MKRILLEGFLILMVLAGCATSRYKPAEKYLENREYNKALRAYLRLLSPHIRDGKRYIHYDREAVTGIGLVYWHMQQYQTAAKIFSMVIKKDPSFGKALFHLGMSLEGMGRDDEAIKVFRRYASIPSSDPYRHVLVGRLDWLVRKRIIHEIQIALQNEAQLNIADLPEKSIAVLYFLNLSEDPQWEPLQKGLAEMIITDLSQVEELKVIERLRLSKLMEELQLSMTGLVDEDTAPRFGKLVGARTMVKGSYFVMSDLRMTLDAGIFRVDKVFLPTSANLEGKLSHLFRMEKELVLRIFDYFGIELSPQQREYIFKIPTENMNAFLNYCRGLDALDREDFKRAQDYFSQAVKMDANFQLAKDQLMLPKIWEVTHNRNPIRVNYEVARLIKSTPKGEARIAYVPTPELVSTSNRLRWMGVHQNAGFIPGNDTRESFQEADMKGAQVLPVLLEEPPLPPSK